MEKTIPKENPTLILYWAEAMLFPDYISKEVKSTKETQFVYQYIKSEINGFDNSNYKEDFFNLMINKYNFDKENLEKVLNNFRGKN